MEQSCIEKEICCVCREAVKSGKIGSADNTSLHVLN